MKTGFFKRMLAWTLILSILFPSFVFANSPVDYSDLVLRLLKNISILAKKESVYRKNTERENEPLDEFLNALSTLKSEEEKFESSKKTLGIHIDEVAEVKTFSRLTTGVSVFIGAISIFLITEYINDPKGSFTPIELYNRDYYSFEPSTNFLTPLSSSILVTTVFLMFVFARIKGIPSLIKKTNKSLAEAKENHVQEMNKNTSRDLLIWEKIYSVFPHLSKDSKKRILELEEIITQDWSSPAAKESLNQIHHILHGNPCETVLSKGTRIANVETEIKEDLKTLLQAESEEAAITEANEAALKQTPLTKKSLK